MLKELESLRKDANIRFISMPDSRDMANGMRCPSSYLLNEKEIEDKKNNIVLLELMNQYSDSTVVHIRLITTIGII